MLPKASQRVDEVVRLGNVIAREYEQEYVGTEHILLAILREGTGIGCKVLTDRGITEKKARAEVDKLVMDSLEETWVFGRLPGTPHFKNVIAGAIDQSQKIKAKEVCTEHVLLSLLKEKGCIAQKALTALGATYEAVRADVLALASQ